jgi:hypothetical protein
VPEVVLPPPVTPPLLLLTVMVKQLLPTAPRQMLLERCRRYA